MSKTPADKDLTPPKKSGTERQRSCPNPSKCKGKTTWHTFVIPSWSRNHWICNECKLKTEI